MGNVGENIRSKFRYHSFGVGFSSFVEYFNFSLLGVYNIYINSSIFGFNPSNESFIYFMYFLGFLTKPIGAILSGFLGDLYGLKKIVIGLGIMMAMGTLIIGVCPAFVQVGCFALIAFAIGRSLQGFAYGGALIGSILTITKTASAKFDKNSPLKIGAIISSTSLAALVANFSIYVLSSYLDKPNLVTFGWRIPFLFGAILSGISLLLLANHVSFTSSNSQSKNALCVELLQALKNEFPKIILAIGFSLLANGLLANFIFYPNLFHKLYNIDLSVIYRASTISLIFSAFFSVAGGFLLQRIPKYRVMLFLYFAFLFLGNFGIEGFAKADFTHMVFFFTLQQCFISMLFVCDYSAKCELFSDQTLYAAMTIVNSFASVIVNFLPLCYHFLHKSPSLSFVSAVNNSLGCVAIISIGLLRRYNFIRFSKF